MGIGSPAPSHPKPPGVLILGVPPVVQLIAKSTTEIIENAPDWFEDELIAGLSAVTFDKHYHECKRAFSYLSACPPF